MKRRELDVQDQRKLDKMLADLRLQSRRINETLNTLPVAPEHTPPTPKTLVFKVVDTHRPSDGSRAYYVMAGPSEVGYRPVRYLHPDGRVRVYAYWYHNEDHVDKAINCAAARGKLEETDELYPEPVSQPHDPCDPRPPLPSGYHHVYDHPVVPREDELIVNGENEDPDASPHLNPRSTLRVADWMARNFQLRGWKRWVVYKEVADDPPC